MKRMWRILLIAGLLAGSLTFYATPSQAGPFRRGGIRGYGWGRSYYGPGWGYRQVYRPYGYRHGWLWRRPTPWVTLLIGMGYAGYGVGYPAYGFGGYRNGLSRLRHGLSGRVRHVDLDRQSAGRVLDGLVPLLIPVQAGFDTR